MIFKRFKEKTDKLNKDNRGLSLVELIVTVLLMGVISGMIVMFISSSRANYELISTETTLQGEAQAATGFIYDILLESEKVEFYGADGLLQASEVGTPADAGTIKVLSTKNGDTYYVVLYEAANSKLRYTSIPASEVDNASSSAISALSLRANRAEGDPLGAPVNLYGDKYALLAEHVTGFEYKDITASNAAISFSNVGLKFEYAGREYTTTIDVKGRNVKEDR